MPPLRASASALIVLAVPASYAMAALVTARLGDLARSWRVSFWCAGFAALAAVLAAGAWSLGGAAVGNPLPTLSLAGVGAPLSVRLDVVTVAMMLLVTFVGSVILRFSRQYLDGDPAQARYVRWLMATLAAVTLLVVANNLLLLALAWICTSLSLHRLLVLYPERTAAQLAARKKFIASRAADLALLSAIGLIGIDVGTLELDGISLIAHTQPLPFGLSVAAVLCVVGAGLKCAQLPFHGWLIQVMEAPTPVSALLHAGVVNIGGFLLIRLGSLMAAVPTAQTILVAWGTATVAIASLVMTTRVSIKVALAWSTCAQMGFMLLECGLGAYSIALLHLIGHSLYKAHAFLTSGNVPAQWNIRVQTAPLARPRWWRWTLGATISVTAVTTLACAVGAPLRDDPAFDVMIAILSIALAPLLAAAVQGLGWRSAAVLAAGSLALAATYLVWHALLDPVIAAPHGTPTMLQSLIVALGFGAACLIFAALRLRPHSRFARLLQPLLFAGLYLDELFTRMTLLLWPTRLSTAAPAAPGRPSISHETPAEATP